MNINPNFHLVWFNFKDKSTHSWPQTADPQNKLKKKKVEAGSTAQVVECLPSMHEALSSTLTTKNK
jgi:hypothetical protein